MTIEFLRARLLSERSVSRTARQRADELAQRVSCDDFFLFDWISFNDFSLFDLLLEKLVSLLPLPLSLPFVCKSCCTLLYY